MYLAYPKPNFKWYFQNSQSSNKSKLTNGSEDLEIYNTFENQSEVYRHVSNIVRKSLKEDYFGFYFIYSSNDVNVSIYNFSVAAQGKPFYNRRSSICICVYFSKMTCKMFS